MTMGVHCTRSTTNYTCKNNFNDSSSHSRLLFSYPNCPGQGVKLRLPKEKNTRKNRREEKTNET